MREGENVPVKIAEKPRKKRKPRRGKQVSLHPLTADQAVWLMFMVSPADVRTILEGARKRKRAKSPAL